jgi:hypothetical protein
VSCTGLWSSWSLERLDGVRILVLHDFDKDGLGILYTLQHDTIRYQFEQLPEIVDLGIRLADVKAEKLQSEPVTYSKYPIGALHRYGATPPEIEMLCPRQGGAKRGKRVELNAFTSDRFIAWLERKLKTHGVKKIVPDAKTLADAYRRAVMLHHVNQGLEELEADAREVSDKVRVPKTLATQIGTRLKKNPALAWDAALAAIAEDAL